MQTQWSRRQFISSAALTASAFAAGAAPAAAPASSKQRIFISTQLSGWGQYYERNGKKPADNLDEMLSAIRDCGYEYAEGEFDTEVPENNLALADKLKAKGLAPICAHMTGVFHESDSAQRNVNKYLEAARAAQNAGFSILNCSTKSLERDKSTAELNVQVTSLRAFGDGLNKLGMRLAIQHRASEFRNGAWEYHYNFRQSSSKSVGFCFDVATIHRGGIMPMDALRDYGARVASWELRQIHEGIWTEDLTSGDIDYEAIAKYAKRYRLAPYFTVALALDKETKITRSVVENHRRSRELVQTLFAR